MIAFFFSNPERVAELQRLAIEVRHTPYAKFGDAPGIGGGLDCIGLVKYLLVSVGAIASFELQRRPRDYSKHVFNERVLRFLRGQEEGSEEIGRRFCEPFPDRDSFTAADLMPGDLLALTTGRELFHFPIVIDPPRCLQCAAPLGVSECDAFDPQYHDNITTVFRALA